MKNIFKLITIIFYLILVFSHCFFSSYTFNKVISTKPIFAQFYSFPILFSILIIATSLLFILINILYKKDKNKSYYWIAIILISLIFLFFGSDRKIKNKIEKGQIIKIVEYNVASNITKENIEKIFKTFNADIAVFPELDIEEQNSVSENKLKYLFKKSNLDFDKYKFFSSIKTSQAIAPVTIIVKKAFGDYYIEENKYMTTFGTIYLKSKNKNNPDIIGLHTAPPIPGLMYLWESDLKLLANKITKGNKNSIIIGDFNATTRHGTMNSIKTHEDILNNNNPFERGTWNRNIPSIFRTPIDHILLPINKYGIKKVKTVDLKNSDHTAIFAQIIKIKNKNN